MAGLKLDISLTEKIIPPPKVEPTQERKEHSAGKAFEKVEPVKPGGKEYYSVLEPFPVLQARVENIIRSMGAASYTYEFKKKRQSLEDVSKKAEKLESKNELGDFIDQRIADQVSMIKDLDKSLLNSANSAMASVRETLDKISSKTSEQMDPTEKRAAMEQLKELREALQNSVDDAIEYSNKLVDEVTDEVIIAANEGFTRKLVETAKKQRSEVQQIEEKSYRLKVEAEEKETVRVQKEKDRQVSQFRKILSDRIANERALEEANKYISEEGNRAVERGEISKVQMQKRSRAVYDKVFKEVLAAGADIGFTNDEILAFIDAYKGRDIRSLIETGVFSKKGPATSSIETPVPVSKPEEVAITTPSVQVTEVKPTTSSDFTVTANKPSQVPLAESKPTVSIVSSSLPPGKGGGGSGGKPPTSGSPQEQPDDFIPSKSNIGINLPEPKRPDNEMTAFAKVKSITTILEEIVKTFVDIKQLFLEPVNMMLDMSVAASKGELRGSTALRTAGESITSSLETFGKASGRIVGAGLGASMAMRSEEENNIPQFKDIGKGLSGVLSELVGKKVSDQLKKGVSNIFGKAATSAGTAAATTATTAGATTAATTAGAATGATGAAAGGVAAGATAGTAVAPGPGTLIGAAVGAAAGSSIGQAIVAAIDPVGAMFKIQGTLTEIAENTANQVQAFSPEIIGAKLDAQLLKLETNIDVAQEFGSSLAKIESSSAQLQNAAFKLGARVVELFEELIVHFLTVITIMLEVAGFLATIASIIKEIALLLSPAIQMIMSAGAAILAWFTKNKTKTTRITDFTKELEKNRPPGV